jgi:pyruvate ferredoxin oxidoreductase gamma subunit
MPAEVSKMGEIRMHGRGGQGTVIAAEMLANAFVIGGKYAAVFPSFGVERRGSPVMAFARYGDTPIRERMKIYKPDILVFLDQSLTEVKTCYSGFKAGGLIIANAKDEQSIVALGLGQSSLATVDAVGIAMQETGTAITNTCLLGAFARATGLIPVDPLKDALKLYLKGETLKKNVRCLERGYEETAIRTFEPAPAKPAAAAAAAVKPTIKPVQFTTPYPAAWSDVSKKVVTAKTGEWRHQRPETDKAACRLCGWCSLYCLVGCMQMSADGYYHPNFEYCKGCGVCAKECPAHAIRMVPEVGQ